MPVSDSPPRSPGQIIMDEARAQLTWGLRKVTHCLGQLDDAQVWWRPRESQNSIANLLLHLTGNLNQRLDSLVTGAPDVRDRPKEFAERGPVPKAELLRRFEQAVKRADHVLAGLTSDQLAEERVYAGLKVTLRGTVLALVFRTITHLTGHTQEIIYITRLQRGDAYVPDEPAEMWPGPRVEPARDSTA